MKEYVLKLQKPLFLKKNNRDMIFRVLKISLNMISEASYMSLP